MNQITNYGCPEGWMEDTQWGAMRYITWLKAEAIRHKKSGFYAEAICENGQCALFSMKPQLPVEGEDEL